jgi:serine/threonine-protein kinase
MNAETGSLASTAAPGELLAGKYRVERLLGEGGMGVVVAAMNEMLQQRVAVKLLRPGALEKNEAVARFLREARAAAKLRSEHVARVLDTGTLEDGRPYMVLEYLDGRDLGDLVEEGPAPVVATAVDYVLQVCEAIAEAHAAGIVHRDLKPRNLFLTRTVDGRPLVKVLDFGISKIEEGPGDMQLTRTTEVFGSPSYMSPEQLRSARHVDHRTDIWALGVILYELLSGRLPFYASTVTELVAVVLMEREPPLHLLRPDLPHGLSAVIGRCLAKSPNDRYGSVLELVHDLESFGTGGAATAADRVRGVARAAGRATVPLAPGSGPLPGYTPPSGVNAAYTPPVPSAPSTPGSHGAAPTAWADTKREPPSSDPGGLPLSAAAHASARSPLFGAAVTVAVLSALGAAGAGVWFVRRPPTATPVDAPLPPMPLPSGRKDLPPAVPVASNLALAVTTAPLPGTAASSASPPPPGPTTSSSRPRQAAPPSPARAAPARPSGDDPLDEIGRR